MPQKKYRLKIDDAIKRQIDQRLPGNIRQRLKRIIADLLLNPRPPEAKQLSHEDGTPSGIYRIGLDDWRLIYQPIDDQELLEIIKVGRKHGPEFYSGVVN